MQRLFEVRRLFENLRYSRTGQRGLAFGLARVRERIAVPLAVLGFAELSVPSLWIVLSLIDRPWGSRCNPSRCNGSLEDPGTVFRRRLFQVLRADIWIPWCMHMRQQARWRVMKVSNFFFQVIYPSIYFFYFSIQDSLHLSYRVMQK